MWSLTLLLMSSGLATLKADLPGFLSRNAGHYIFTPRNENASYSQLFHDLLEAYDPLAVPVPQQGLVVNITLRYSLFQLVNMDESNEMMVVNSWINMLWTDAFMTWDPAAYHGISRISIPASFLWLPDLAVYNGGTEGELDLREMSSYNAIVDSSGFVTWWVKYIGKTPCAFDLASFPWDIQTCCIEIGPWVTDISMVDLSAEVPDIRANDTGSWIIEGIKHSRTTYVYDGIGYARIQYAITYRRKPLFYIFNFLMPSVLLAIVSMASYLFPVDVTERVSLPVALFLSASFLLFASTDYMPIQSDVIPVMAKILCKLMADILLCVFFNVLVIEVSRRPSDKKKGKVSHDDNTETKEEEEGMNGERKMKHKRRVGSCSRWMKHNITAAQVNKFFAAINLISVGVSLVWLLSWCL